MFDRRGFLKFVGGVAVGTLATPVVWQGLDDISIWSQNWPWIPKLDYGNNDNTYIHTVSKLCPSATGTKVRLVGGRPVRVLGDVEHPLSRGGISALAATEVQLRYSPARLKRPLKKAPDGTFVSISWDEAEKLLQQECAKAKGKDGLVCLSGDENGTMNELFSAFTSHMGSSRFFLMPGDAQPTACAWERMGGRGRVGYDFAHSDFVLALGANVLETWGPVVGNRRAWGAARPQDVEPAMRLAFAGPVQNNTAAGADLWLPIKPGTELALALGIAHALIKAGKSCPVSGMAEFTAATAPWTPEKVTEVTGLSSERLAQVVDALLKAKAPLVIAGSEMEQGGGALPLMAGIALNMLLDRVNKDGGLRALPVPPAVVPGALDYAGMMRRDFTAYVQGVSQGKQPAGRMLMFYEANPVYALPFGDGIDELFKKSAFAVSFSCFLDETASRCNLVIPSALGLERFDDVIYPFGVGENVYSLAQPVAEPLFEARPAGDVLLRISRALGYELGFVDVPAMLKAKALSVGADWTKLLQGKAYTSRGTLPATGLIFPGVVLVKGAAAFMKAEGKASEAAKGSTPKLAVATVTKRALGTAETAIPPFNTKTITKEELVQNELVARFNGATAAKLGLRQGARITLSNETGSVKAVVGVYEGITNDTVALTTGFGHTSFGAFNSGKGMNVMRLFTAASEPGTGLATWLSLGVTAVKA